MMYHGCTLLGKDSLVRQAILEDSETNFPNSWNSEVNNLFSKYKISETDRSILRETSNIDVMKRKWKRMLKKI